MKFSPETMLMIKAARAAGKVAMAGFGKPIKHSFKKSYFDWVTGADIEAEKEIIAMLSSKHPDYGFLAEESGKREGKEFTWIIDPIDGTNNFASGIPYFCHSIALAQGNELLSAVVLDPTREELFVAEKGRGAFLNGKRIRVSGRTDLREFTCITSVRAGLENESIKRKQERFLNFYPKVRSIRIFGASELDLCYLAAGRLEVFANFNMFPWDGAAGALIVREAGGTATNEKGKPWQINGKALVATNGKKHRQVLEILGL